MARSLKTKLSRSKKADENLYGLLETYKVFNTYIRVFQSEDEKNLCIEFTGNPKDWKVHTLEQFESYHEISRLGIGIDKKIIKYILPHHIIGILGPLAGIKIEQNRAKITDNLESEGYYLIETSARYKTRAFQGIKKLINLKPHKKFELLEKSLALHQDNE